MPRQLQIEVPDAPLTVTSKMLGDAGEHFALSQLTFAGKPATKMPDGWTGYDLAVDTGQSLDRVSVKTRSETERWKAGSWFTFDERKECDWLVFVFQRKDGSIRSWVIPYSVAKDNADNRGENRKDPHMRYVSWAKLNRQPLSCYENNWALAPNPSPQDAEH